MFTFTFSMVINRNIECMQMSAVAACDWSVAGKHSCQIWPWHWSAHLVMATT